MATTQRTADRNQYPLPPRQQWTVAIGRVADHMPVTGGETLILICCQACGRDLVRLAPGDQIDGTMFFECSTRRQAAAAA